VAEVTGRDYARFFFDDIIDAGLEQLHAELGWFTETDQRDPLIQLFRFVAYLGHRDAAIMDLIAGELAWKTLQRRASAVVLADLVGQRLTADSPSNADILFDLFGTPGVADVLVPDLAIFRTAADSDTAAVPFENQDGSQVVGAGGLDYLLIADNGGVFTGPAASIANPWGPVPALNDALYFGHANMMFSSLQFVASGTPDDYYAAWEYYDGRFRTSQPDNGTVAVSGPGITMDVDDFLGDTATSYVGLTIRVRHTTSDVEDAHGRVDERRLVEAEPVEGGARGRTDHVDHGRALQRVDEAGPDGVVDRRRVRVGWARRRGLEDRHASADPVGRGAVDRGLLPLTVRTLRQVGLVAGLRPLRLDVVGRCSAVGMVRRCTVSPRQPVGRQLVVLLGCRDDGLA